MHRLARRGGGSKVGNPRMHGPAPLSFRDFLFEPRCFQPGHVAVVAISRINSKTGPRRTRETTHLFSRACTRGEGPKSLER